MQGSKHSTHAPSTSFCEQHVSTASREEFSGQTQPLSHIREKFSEDVFFHFPSSSKGSEGLVQTVSVQQGYGEEEGKPLGSHLKKVLKRNAFLSSSEDSAWFEQTLNHKSREEIQSLKGGGGN